MNLPDINDIITTQKALALCRHFSLDYLVDRIEADLKKYKDWTFDGCSGMKKWCAKAFLAGVRAGGTEVFGLSFSWGFAHK